MNEFKKIIRNMKPIEYIKIGTWIFWKTKDGKFCKDGKDKKTAINQKQLCYIYEYEILKNDYKLI